MTLLCCTVTLLVVTAKPSSVLCKNVVLPYQESYFLLLASFFKECQAMHAQKKNQYPLAEQVKNLNSLLYKQKKMPEYTITVARCVFFTETAHFKQFDQKLQPLGLGLLLNCSLVTWCYWQLEQTTAWEYVCQQKATFLGIFCSPVFYRNISLIYYLAYSAIPNPGKHQRNRVVLTLPLVPMYEH